MFIISRRARGGWIMDALDRAILRRLQPDGRQTSRDLIAGGLMLAPWLVTAGPGLFTGRARDRELTGNAGAVIARCDPSRGGPADPGRTYRG
jgi:hypothetical protein